MNHDNRKHAVRDHKFYLGHIGYYDDLEEGVKVGQEYYDKAVAVNISLIKSFERPSVENPLGKPQPQGSVYSHPDAVAWAEQEKERQLASLNTTDPSLVKDPLSPIIPMEPEIIRNPIYPHGLIQVLKEEKPPASAPIHEVLPNLPLHPVLEGLTPEEGQRIILAHAVEGMLRDLDHFPDHVIPHPTPRETIIKNHLLAALGVSHDVPFWRPDYAMPLKNKVAVMEALGLGSEVSMPHREQVEVMREKLSQKSVHPDNDPNLNALTEILEQFSPGCGITGQQVMEELDKEVAASEMDQDWTPADQHMRLFPQASGQHREALEGIVRDSSPEEAMEAINRAADQFQPYGKSIVDSVREGSIPPLKHSPKGQRYPMGGPPERKPISVTRIDEYTTEEVWPEHDVQVPTEIRPDLTEAEIKKMEEWFMQNPDAPASACPTPASLTRENLRDAIEVTTARQDEPPLVSQADIEKMLAEATETGEYVILEEEGSEEVPPRIQWNNYLQNYAKVVDPTQGGCWICHSDEDGPDGGMHFTGEFDAAIHMTCLKQAFLTEHKVKKAQDGLYTMNPEIEIIAREFGLTINENDEVVVPATGS
jgi:hypothetical protein